MSDMNVALSAFRSELVKRNTPIVKAAEKVLWLAQGDGVCSRMVRSVTFRVLDVVEAVLPARRRKERELKLKLKEDGVKTTTTDDTSSTTSQIAV